MSVTEVIVPAVVLISTAPPLIVKGTLLGSFKETVMVEVEIPLAEMLVGLAAMVEFVVLAATGT